MERRTDRSEILLPQPLQDPRRPLPGRTDCRLIPPVLFSRMVGPVTSLNLARTRSWIGAASARRAGRRWYGWSRGRSSPSLPQVQDLASRGHCSGCTTRNPDSGDDGLQQNNLSCCKQPGTGAVRSSGSIYNPGGGNGAGADVRPGELVIIPFDTSKEIIERVNNITQIIKFRLSNVTST